MTAGISLILGKTGAHRAPLQSLRIFPQFAKRRIPENRSSRGTRTLVIRAGEAA